MLIEGGVAVTRREIREHLFLMLFRKEFHDSHDMLEQVEIYLSELREPTEEIGDMRQIWYETCD